VLSSSPWHLQEHLRDGGGVIGKVFPSVSMALPKCLNLRLLCILLKLYGKVFVMIRREHSDVNALRLHRDQPLDSIDVLDELQYIILAYINVGLYYTKLLEANIFCQIEFLT
jgi:hypothetical protein